MAVVEAQGVAVARDGLLKVLVGDVPAITMGGGGWRMGGGDRGAGGWG